MYLLRVCLFLVCVRVCLHALAMFSKRPSLTSLTCEVEEDDYIPRGQLYLHGDPSRNTDTRNTLRIPLHCLQQPVREERQQRRRQ